MAAHFAVRAADEFLRQMTGFAHAEPVMKIFRADGVTATLRR